MDTPRAAKINLLLSRTVAERVAQEQDRTNSKSCPRRINEIGVHCPQVPNGAMLEEVARGVDECKTVTSAVLENYKHADKVEVNADAQKKKTGDTGQAGQLRRNCKTQVAPTRSRAQQTTDLGQNKAEVAAYDATRTRNRLASGVKSNCRDTCRKWPFLGSVPASPWVGRPLREVPA